MSNSNVVNRKKYTVVLKLSKANVLTKIETARHFATQMTGNPHFLTPQPTPADILSSAQQLELAWEASRDGSRTALQTMYSREVDLDILLSKLGHYVEGIANETTIPNVVITSAGMQFRLSGGKQAPVFSVENGDLKGTVNAVTRSEGGRTSYMWEYKLKGASDWTLAAVTLKARYQYTNLTSLTAYEFRQKTITPHGELEWTDPIELGVL